MDAAALIKAARSRAGMTQAELAEASGTSQPTIAAYESGAKSPNVSTFTRILEASGSAIEIALVNAPPTRGLLLEDLRAHADGIRAIADRRFVEKIRVFGSVARGEATATSDVDLLVDYSVHAHGLLPLVAFGQEVQELLGRDVDATTEELLKPEVRATALRDAVLL